MDRNDRMHRGDWWYDELKNTYWRLGYDYGGTPPKENQRIDLALLGDDRPAPNGDEFETEMLRILSR